ncbi:lantibiotic dehydratase [Sphingobacterium sp. InxBP1]|uniref:lantibiotic dehydratase n=1 Tax=Sphingobacterium sp. InxBP1 TaxID=2870328 RepID=UPI002244D74C|nr:lantibiotic dehydratase [Sphingobacterium sp. InxBP1]
MSYAVLDLVNSIRSEEDLWNFLIKLFSDNQVLDSIFIASASLHEELLLALKSPFNEKCKKLLPTLYKYISRMASRPTPFGLFSAITLAKVCDLNTKIILSENFTPKFRLDLEVIEQINTTFLNNPDNLEDLVYFPNTTIFFDREDLVYIEYYQIRGERSYQWSRIKNNPLIKVILDYCTFGASFGGIKEKLINIGVPEIRSVDFIKQLIKLKLLIPETEPIVTTIASTKILSRINELTDKSEYAAAFKELATFVEQVQMKEISVSNIWRLKKLGELLENKPRNLIQADMYRKLKSGTLSTQLIQTIGDEILELQLNIQTEAKLEIEYFTKRFTAKFGDQEIPLLEALDLDRGIGYGRNNQIIIDHCPLLEGLVENIDENDHRKGRLLQKYIEKQTKGKNHKVRVINLETKDLNSLGYKNSKDISLPAGFYHFGNLLLQKGSDLSNQTIRFNLLKSSGVSSIPLMTRFSYLDKELQHKLEECAEEEQKKADDSILAEVVFFPSGKAGNVLSRNSLFKYEIPIIGQAAVDYEHTIPLADIMVRVDKGKIILRSKKLNKIILPRLSSAHNFHYGMTIYRFLCDLQFQDNPINFGWDWGNMNSSTFLPRVEYKHLILSRARWRISKEVFVGKEFGDDIEKTKFLVRYYDLPDRVLLSQGDNELLLDLQNEIGARILIKELNRKEVVLYENLYDSFDSPVIDEKGEMLANEVIIPLSGNSIESINSIRFEPNEQIIRKFIPGSEWLFCKIYCGEKSSDNILIDHIRPLVNYLKKNKLIQKWFYIRYHDPEPHIRVRLNFAKDINTSFSETNIFIQKTFNNLIKQGIISRLTFDTYERELERYGPNNITHCETLFEVESNMMLNILPYIKEVGENLRWKFAIVTVNELFSAFGYQGKAKLQILEILKESFYKEFDKYYKLKFVLDQNYRKYREDISNFLKKQIHSDEKINFQLATYRDSLKNIYEKCASNNDFRQKPKEIVCALSHMLLNRIYFTKQREQEMVTYHFLSKFLISEYAKNPNHSLPEIPSLL